MEEDVLRILKKEAQKSNMKKKISAGLIYRNKLVSKGHNYHTRMYMNFTSFTSSMHAEQDCINKINSNLKILKNSILIIVRIDKNEEIVKCEPCHTCKKLIEKFKIPKIIYY